MIEAVDDAGSNFAAWLDGEGWQSAGHDRRRMCSQSVLPGDEDELRLAAGVATLVSVDLAHVEQLERERIAKKAL